MLLALATDRCDEDEMSCVCLCWSEGRMQPGDGGFYRLRRLLAVNVDSNNASGVEESTMTTMPCTLSSSISFSA